MDKCSNRFVAAACVLMVVVGGCGEPTIHPGPDAPTTEALLSEIENAIRSDEKAMKAATNLMGPVDSFKGHRLRQKDGVYSLGEWQITRHGGGYVAEIHVMPHLEPGDHGCEWRVIVTMARKADRLIVTDVQEMQAMLTRTK